MTFFKQHPSCRPLRTMSSHLRRLLAKSPKANGMARWIAMCAKRWAHESYKITRGVPIVEPVRITISWPEVGILTSAHVYALIGVRVTRARRPRRRYRYAAKFLDSASSTKFISEKLKINTISKGFRCYRYRSKNFDAIDDCESVYSNVLIKYINIIIFSIYKNERNWKRNILALASKTDFENSFSAISALKILYYLRKCLCCYNYYLHLSYALRYCIIWNIFMRICNINEHCSNTRVNLIWSTATYMYEDVMT